VTRIISTWLTKIARQQWKNWQLPCSALHKLRRHIDGRLGHGVDLNFEKGTLLFAVGSKSAKLQVSYRSLSSICAQRGTQSRTHSKCYLADRSGFWGSRSRNRVTRYTRPYAHCLPSFFDVCTRIASIRSEPTDVKLWRDNDVTKMLLHCGYK
jgi:hypothetical protein